MLLAVLVAAGVLIVATRSEDDPPPATNTAPAKNDFSLTDEEAIAEFTELNQLAIRAVQERDASLISMIFTQDGPTARQASQEIRQLLRDGVIDKTRFVLVTVEVIANEPGELQLREKSRLFPCFVTEGGRDITDGHAEILQTGTWTLRRVDASWLVHDIVLEKERIVDKSHARCP